MTDKFERPAEPLDPLTDQEAEENARLLIRYYEVAQQRREELLEWLVKLTIKRRLLLLEES